MASSLADHHHMIKREVDHHHHHNSVVHHIHDEEEDIENEENDGDDEEEDTFGQESPVFGHHHHHQHNLRSSTSSRNMYSIPSISITMSSHHPVKRDVNLSASACLDIDITALGTAHHGHNNGHGNKRSNGSNISISGSGHQNNGNNQCMNGQNQRGSRRSSPCHRLRHRSSPSVSLERYCESPSTFLLDTRHAVADFNIGGHSDVDDDDDDCQVDGHDVDDVNVGVGVHHQDDEDEDCVVSNHRHDHQDCINGRSNSRLSEGGEEISLFHSSSVHLVDTMTSAVTCSSTSPMLGGRDVTMVTPSIIESVVSSSVLTPSATNCGQDDEIIVTSEDGRGSSSEVIVSTTEEVMDEEMMSMDHDGDVHVVCGEDVIVVTTSKAGNSCPTSSSTTTSIVGAISCPTPGSSILRNQLLRGSSPSVNHGHGHLGQQMCILKEPPLNHYNSNHGDDDDDEESTFDTNDDSSHLLSHSSVPSSGHSVSMAQRMVPSSCGHQVTSTINPPTILTTSSTSLHPMEPLKVDINQQQISSSASNVGANANINGHGHQQTQSMDIKILPAGLFQLASNLAAVFPPASGSAATSGHQFANCKQQIAIQLLREDGTSIILPITALTRPSTTVPGQQQPQTLSISTAPMVTTTSKPLTNGTTSNVVSTTGSINNGHQNVISSTVNPITTLQKVSTSSSSCPSSTSTSKSVPLKRINGSKNVSNVSTTNAASKVNISMPTSTASTSPSVQSTLSQALLTSMATKSVSTTSLIQSSASSSSSASEHSSERPFKCELCSSTFTRLGNYTRHKKIHSLPTKVTTIFDTFDTFQLFLIL